jgi:hypothetical protein
MSSVTPSLYRLWKKIIDIENISHFHSVCVRKKLSTFYFSPTRPQFATTHWFQLLTTVVLMFSRGQEIKTRDRKFFLHLKNITFVLLIVLLISWKTQLLIFWKTQLLISWNSISLSFPLMLYIEMKVCSWK